MKLLSKSLPAILLSFVILLGACSNETDSADDPEEPAVVDGNVSVRDNFNDPELTLAELRAMPISDLTPLEMTRVMGHGINLGNTMEACNPGRRSIGADPSVFERMWGQPITTQESIDGMKAAGFSTLRIPVAWTNAMLFAVENEMNYDEWDFTIGDAYLDRVEEIINYALNAGMIVIVNNHWDHGWWSMFGHPEQEIRDLAMEIYTTMWTQLAERYGHFDGRVIFESANEELGDRFNDETAFSPTGGTLTTDEQYEMLNAVNQKFVDIIRASGGNNAQRFLLVKGFHTCVIRTSDDRFSMPSDPADKLILGVHYYEPSSYCLQSDGVGSWGTISDVERMREHFNLLERFTEQGYGILIGEWGVLRNFGEDRITFMTNLLALADKYGIATTLWDTGGIYCREDYIIRCRYGTDDHIDDVAALFKAHCVEARAEMTIDDIVFAAEMSLIQLLRKAEARPQITFSDDEAFAWLMFSNGDFTLQYSVGDLYNPNNVPPGLVPTDVEVTGPGTYTVALDFTGTSGGRVNGIAFSALAIMNGELLWPGYVIELTEVLINGERAEPNGVPYTTNDDPVTTRVNLYNQWVNDETDIDPETARTPGGVTENLTAQPFAAYKDTRIETIQITFEYYAPEG
jgi:endoglucanase